MSTIQNEYTWKGRLIIKFPIVKDIFPIRSDNLFVSNGKGSKTKNGKVNLIISLTNEKKQVDQTESSFQSIVLRNSHIFTLYENFVMG